MEISARSSKTGQDNPFRIRDNTREQAERKNQWSLSGARTQVTQKAVLILSLEEDRPAGIAQMMYVQRVKRSISNLMKEKQRAECSVCMENAVDKVSRSS